MVHVFESMYNQDYHRSHMESSIGDVQLWVLHLVLIPGCCFLPSALPTPPCPKFLVKVVST